MLTAEQVLEAYNRQCPEAKIRLPDLLDVLRNAHFAAMKEKAKHIRLEIRKLATVIVDEDPILGIETGLSYPDIFRKIKKMFPDCTMKYDSLKVCIAQLNQEGVRFPTRPRCPPNKRPRPRK